MDDGQHGGGVNQPMPDSIDVLTGPDDVREVALRYNYHSRALRLLDEQSWVVKARLWRFMFFHCLTWVVAVYGVFLLPGPWPLIVVAVQLSTHVSLGVWNWRLSRQDKRFRESLRVDPDTTTGGDSDGSAE